MLLGGSDGGTTTVKTWKMAQEPPPLSTRFFGCMFIHSVTNQFGYVNKKTIYEEKYKGPITGDRVQSTLKVTDLFSFYIGCDIH